MNENARRGGVRVRSEGGALAESRQRHRAALAAGRGAAADFVPPPSPTEVAVLHERVLRGAPGALDAMVERLLPLLSTLVKRGSGGVPHDQVMNAVEDALLEYCGAPSRFDSGRGVPLVMFLMVAARRNLLNSIRSKARRRAREQRLQRELLVMSPAHVVLEDGSSRRGIVAAADLQSLTSDLTMAEREAIALWLDGERRTVRLARALGVEDLPVPEQRRWLKRLKDRFRLRVRRWRDSTARR